MRTGETTGPDRQRLAIGCGWTSLVLAAVLASIQPALGQAVPQSGKDPATQASPVRTPAGVSVTGIVLDPSKASVPGAEVALFRANHSRVQGTTTDVEGAFRFDAVSAGSYEIRVRQTGFKPLATRLKVGVLPPAPVQLGLSIDDVQAEITVQSRPTTTNTEVSENLDAIVLEPEQLDNLPILGNDVLGALSQMLDPSSVGSHGATLIVDGMPASEVGVPKSAIQEIRINQNPYSAEFARPGHGRIEVITKAGTSKYHGSFEFGLRDYRLDARNAFAVSRPPEQRRNFEGYLSGPLGRNRKTNFDISASHQEDDLQQVVYAQEPSGGIRENVPNPQRTTWVVARISRQVGKNQVFSVRYAFSDWSDYGGGIGGFTLPEVGIDSTAGKHYVHFTHRAVITHKLANELSARVGRATSFAESRLPGVRQVVVLDAFTGGGAQIDNRQTDYYAQLMDVASWSHKRHFLKLGINIPDLTNRTLYDRSNFDGTFQFSSLEDYSRGKPFSFIQQRGDGQVSFWSKEVGLFLQDDIRVRPNLSLGVGLRYDWQNHLADHNNLAPRLSFAFAPWKNRKTVLRGGAGLFYDTTGREPIADLLRYDGSRLQRVVVSNPGYPDPFSGQAVLATIPGSIVRFAPDLRSPYSTQFSIGVERQLQKSTTLTATYIGTRGDKLFRSRDLNAPLPPFYEQRPNPSLGIVREIESSGRLESDVLRVAIRGNVTRTFSGLLQYTLGRAYNDTSGIGSFPANQYDLSGEWSRAPFDQRHAFYVYGTLNAGKLFKLGLVSSIRSGSPYSLTTGRDDNHDTFPNDRPPGVIRNSLSGTGSATLDLRWSKQFLLNRANKEGPSTTLALDAFNVTNQVNFSSFVGNLSSPFFSQPVAAGPARRIQVSGRITF